MADVFTKAKRSAVMARIRGSGNKDTELRLIALMREHGYHRLAAKRARFRKKVEIDPRPERVFTSS